MDEKSLTGRTAQDAIKNIPAVDAVEYEFADDGTLEITVPNGTKVGRVLVSEEGTHLGGLYYPDDERVSVVRCRECRWFCEGQNESEAWEWCDVWKKDCWQDCYCACGQRREEEHNAVD